jgi:hemerythrin-like metal-binding protein
MDAEQKDIIVRWTADMSVGCVLLDRHNERMFGDFAQAEAMAETLTPAALTHWLASVLDRFEILLQKEEAELADAGYPELTFHRTLHDRARARLQAVRVQLNKSPDARALVMLARESCVAFSVWLMRHIQDADKLFLPYVDARYRSVSK